MNLNTTKQIVRYVRGQLSEEEALRLWEELLKNPEDMKQLELYLMLGSYYSQVSDKKEE